MKRVTPLFVPKRRGVVVLLLLSLFIGAGAAVAQVWTNLRAIELGYEISKLTKKRRSLLEANRRLRIEVALLKSPARIGRLAREIGLREPEPEQIRRLAAPAAGGVGNVKRKASASDKPGLPKDSARNEEPVLSAASNAWPTAARQEATP
ncbi:MAG: cell division protein FtsL [Myxococcales bacterium]|nr:cell division protein FtsL [Myxococcales bacterium]